MSKHPLIRLGDYVHILSGFAFKSSYFNNEERGKPLIRIRDINSGKTSTYFDGPFDDRYIINNGDLLIGMDGEFNISRWTGGEALLNQRVCKVSSINRILDLDYLFRVLRIKLKQIEDKTPFVTVKHLSVKTLEDLEIPLPPLPEQEHIAQVLDEVDGLRRKRRESIEKLKELQQSIFLDIFGDPITNPRTWPIYKLDNLANIKSGLQVTRKRQTLNLQVPYLRVANVFKGKIDISEIKQMGVTIAELERARIEYLDILVVEGHGNSEEVGRCAVWDHNIENCIHQNHLIRVTADRSIVNPFYLSYFINSTGGRYQLNKKGKTTSGLNTISTSDVRSLEIPLPPLELQENFLKLLKESNIRKQIFENNLQKLDQLFASLQNQFFSDTPSTISLPSPVPPVVMPTIKPSSPEKDLQIPVQGRLF